MLAAYKKQSISNEEYNDYYFNIVIKIFKIKSIC